MSLSFTKSISLIASKLRKIFSLGTVFLLMISCSNSQVPRNTVVGILDTAPRTLDPVIATDANSQNLHNLIYGALIRIDQNLKIVPELVEQYRVQKYQKFYFKLKKNLSFEDGSPITTSNVVESIKLYQAESSPHSSVFQKINSIKVLNDQEIELVTKKVEPYFLNEFTLMKMIKRNNNKILSSGRYIVKSFDRSLVVLNRNPRYQDPEMKNVETIELRVVADDLTRYQLFKRGDVNVLLNSLSLSLSDKLKNENDKLNELTFLSIPSTTIGYIGYNFKNKFLANKNVRKAIQMAFDKKNYIEQRMKVFTKSSQTLLSPLLKEYNTNLDDVNYDVEQANRILDHEGFLKNKNGIRFTLEFKTTGDKGVIDFVEIFKQYMKQIGIDIKIRSLEFGTYYSDLKSGNFELITSRWIGITNPQILRRLFHSAEIGKLNRGSYQNTQLDQKLDLAENEVNDVKRTAIYYEIQKILNEEKPYYVLWHWNVAIFAKKNISNIILFPNGNFLTYAYLYVQSP